MAIFDFIQKAFESAPASAFLPIGIAGGILAFVVIAVLLQISLRVRYRSLRQFILRVSQRLGETPPVDVRAAVREIVRFLDEIEASESQD